MVSRMLLHINKLSDFKAWIEKRGYKIECVTNCNEVLRATGTKNNKKDTIIIYKKANAKEHLSVMDKDCALVRRFIKETRKGVPNENIKSD